MLTRNSSSLAAGVGARYLRGSRAHFVWPDFAREARVLAEIHIVIGKLCVWLTSATWLPTWKLQFHSTLRIWDLPFVQKLCPLSRMLSVASFVSC